MELERTRTDYSVALSEEDMLALVRAGHLTLSELIRLFSVEPARFLRKPGGTLAVKPLRRASTSNGRGSGRSSTRGRNRSTCRFRSGRPSDAEAAASSRLSGPQT